MCEGWQMSHGVEPPRTPPHNAATNFELIPEERNMPALPHVAAVAALAAALFSPVASAACYQIYAPDGELIYRSIEPPVTCRTPAPDAAQGCPWRQVDLLARPARL